MRTVIGVVAAALLTASVTAPAQATVRERIRSQSEWSFTEECDFPVDVTGSGSELLIREGKNKDDRAFPVLGPTASGSPISPFGSPGRTRVSTKKHANTPLS